MKTNFIYKFVLIILDLLFLIGIFYISLCIREYIDIPFQMITLKKFSFTFLIIMFVFFYEGIYKYRYDFWHESFKIFKSLLFSYLIVSAILTLTKTNLHYSRIFLTIYFILLFVFLPVFKRIEKFLMFKILKIFIKNIFIVGNEKQKKMLKKEFKDNWYLGMVYSNNNYGSVFITSKNLDIRELNELIDKHSHTNSELYLIPYVTSINFAHSDILEYTNLKINSIVVENKLLNRLNILIKDIFDYSVAILLFPFFILIHLVIVFFIKKDSEGKVFFKQKRLGKNGEIFYVYKYRTMYENSNEILKKYLENHSNEIEYYEKYHKYKNDPRITKTGKILRVTSLDELPQIINVLKGEMSLVGPRPYMLNELDELGKYKEFILKVKPGLTGLWQVSGRNNLTFKERNELEVWYIKNWSLWLDLVILIKTVKVVLLKIGVK